MALYSVTSRPYNTCSGVTNRATGRGESGNSSKAKPVVFNSITSRVKATSKVMVVILLAYYITSNIFTSRAINSNLVVLIVWLVVII